MPCDLKPDKLRATADKMSNFAKLLAKLEKLDPDTWDALEKIENNSIIYSCVIGQVSEYILQGAIQDAIKAKFGGRFTLNGASIQMKFYEAFIEYDDVDCIGYYEGNGGTPAEALLAAYVQALEAEASK